MKDGEATKRRRSKNGAASDDDCVGIHSTAVIAAGPNLSISVFALEDVVGETLSCHKTTSVPGFFIIVTVLLIPVAMSSSHMPIHKIIAARNVPIGACLRKVWHICAVVYYSARTCWLELCRAGNEPLLGDIMISLDSANALLDVVLPPAALAAR